MYYDKIFFTNLPSFYKINLYAEIAKKKQILVVFTGDAAESRNSDFYSGTINFDCKYYESKNIVYRIYYTIYLLIKYQYNECVIGGWDSIPLWICAFLSCKKKNSVVVESSFYESVTYGLKGYIKRLFVSRIRCKAYVSGESQLKLVKELNFKGKIVKTKGVGVFNFCEQPKYEARSEVRNFIFVGRLIDVKNLEFLIRVFNSLPFYTLNIVGFGILETYLKSIAKSNIVFHGAVDNKKLYNYYRSNDVFILPSKQEAWGIVVEEALNNGLPVLVSNKVGCGPEIVNESNGLVFKYNSESDLLEKINTISNIEFYNSLRKNISSLNFREIEESQVKCYL